MTTPPQHPGQRPGPDQPFGGPRPTPTPSQPPSGQPNPASAHGSQPSGNLFPGAQPPPGAAPSVSGNQPPRTNQPGPYGQPSPYAAQPPRPGQPSPAGQPSPYAGPATGAPHGGQPGPGQSQFSGPANPQPPYGSGYQPPTSGQLPPVGPAPAAAYQLNEATAQKMKQRRKVTGIVLLVVAVIVAAVIGLAWWTSSQKAKDSAAAMTGLLAALEAGDATSALNYLDLPADGEVLLTDEALAAQAGTFTYNPELVKATSTADHAYQASVSINGVDKVVQWDVNEVGGEWKVSAYSVLTEVVLNPDLPHVINGIPIPAGTQTVQALPGSYSVTSGMALLAYAPTQTSFDLFTGGSYNFQAELVLVDGVEAMVADHVRALLNGCIAERSAPTACHWPLTFTNGVAKDGSVNWQLEPADPAAGLTISTVGVDASSSYSATVTLRYTTLADGLGVIDDGSEGVFDGYQAPRSTSFNVDLSGDMPVVSII